MTRPSPERRVIRRSPGPERRSAAAERALRGSDQNRSALACGVGNRKRSTGGPFVRADHAAVWASWPAGRAKSGCGDRSESALTRQKQKFLVNFLDGYCNFRAVCALWSCIVMSPLQRTMLIALSSQPADRDRNPGRRGRGFPYSGLTRRGAAIRRQSRPPSTHCHAASAGRPIVTSRARFSNETANAVSGVRPKLAPRRM